MWPQTINRDRDGKLTGSSQMVAISQCYAKRGGNEKQDMHCTWYNIQTRKNGFLERKTIIIPACQVGSTLALLHYYKN